MKHVHDRNAAVIERIVGEFGWPGRSLAGDDGAAAAWRIPQHAITRPDVQRGYLPLLEKAAEAQEIPAWQSAYLIDRIRFFEGKLRVYGAHYARNDEGLNDYYRIEDPSGVNGRRKSVGIDPLSRKGQTPVSPEKLAAERKEQRDWARSVGWLDGW